VDGEAVAATPGGRELLTGALAVVRYHRATAPHEVSATQRACSSSFFGPVPSRALNLDHW
jgi:hypothetical protein